MASSLSQMRVPSFVIRLYGFHKRGHWSVFKKREYHFAKWHHNCNFKEVYISLVIPNFRPPTMMLATNGLCLRVKEFIFETEICEANFLLPTIEVDNDIYIVRMWSEQLVEWRWLKVQYSSGYKPHSSMPFC